MATTTNTARPGTRDIPVGIGLAVVHIGAIGVFFPQFFSWWAIATAVALYWLTGMGITLGFHRLLTHRSFVVPKWAEYTLSILGTLAIQGGPIQWVATHRAHHAHSDREGDPHDSNRGMAWAHMEWLYRRNTARLSQAEMARWAPDLVSDPVYRAMDRYAVWIQIALGAILLVAGGWPFLIWGLFARAVFTYHCTWLVNSASHAVGYRSFRTTDRSTNNWLVALISFGEGWHNNHHAFPFSARHGMRWFEFDPAWITIKVLAALKIARNVKLPSKQAMARLSLDLTRPRKAQRA
jgi:stearoyl-CoA desaturase (delta-9 desaturase)